MRSVSKWGKFLSLLLLAACATTAIGAGAPLEYIKTRTFQNLAPSPSKFLGHYLSVDADGATGLSSVSSQEESGSHWELKKAFWKERGYTTYTIVQRGNNKNNGRYLAIDKTTGALVYTKTEVPTARWLIRSAGKYQGWDAVYIQNLAETGTYDMHFLAIDEATGEVTLSAKPTAGAHWHMADTPYLPAESLY